MSTKPALVKIADIASIIGADGMFGDYTVVRSSDGFVEVRHGAFTALLADPGLWRDGERLQRELSRCSSSMTLLVCLGSDEDMADVVALRKRAVLASLTLPTSAVALHASLDNSMALIAMQQRAEERGQVAERFRYELSELVEIATRLNSERDIKTLLGLILEKSRYVTGADAGSVYVLVPHPDAPGEQILRFEVAQNESVDVSDLKAFPLEISSRSIVGAAVISAEAINIPDLYQLDVKNPWGVEHNRSFDDRTGYRTHSALTVPMINPRDEVIGVIQLINKKTTRRPLRTEDDFAEHVVPFEDRAVELCKTLAYQAAIALDNALLYEELRQVFEGFVEASVMAIEARDPTTSGHSRRVADLTVGLAAVVDRTSSGRYQQQRFTADDLKEMEYAGLLHDFGKVGVPEQVLVKAQKLYEWDLDQILLRFDYIRQWLRSEALAKQLDLAKAQAARLPSRIAAIKSATQKQEDFLDLCVETVLKANQPTVLESESVALLEEIASHTFIDPRGDERPYLSAEELTCLRIRRGSLNQAEREQIESHVVHSFNFLCTIPWGRSFSKIPIIAGDHHEKLDGTGYPSGKRASDIPVQAKMMTIADIFDALTASDRPYKRALPVQRALDILHSDVKAGKVDAELLQLFIDGEVFAKTVSK